MAEELERLSEVQSRDLDLLALEEERGRTPPELLEMQDHKENLRASLEATQKKHRELGRRVRENELELQALEARRKSAADSAVAAGNSKEASQYQNQELQFATRVQELEEDTLPLMERLEALEGEITELEGQLEELEPQLAEVRNAEEARVSEVEGRIAVLAGERDALARDINASLLKQYEGVRRSKRGVGLVPIIDNQRCGGCNMQLPIHVIQKAKAGRGVTRCPSCGRILWAKE